MDKVFAKKENGLLIFPPKFKDGIINYDKNETKLIEDGYKEVIYTELPEDLEKTDEQEYYCYYEETEDKITQLWGVRDIDRNVLISRYKKELAELDIEMSRSLEDLIKFHMETNNYAPHERQIEIIDRKQALRDKINALEAES